MMVKTWTENWTNNWTDIRYKLFQSRLPPVRTVVDRQVLSRGRPPFPLGALGVVLRGVDRELTSLDGRDEYRSIGVRVSGERREHCTGPGW
jgi:hypothetical protein